MRIVLLTKTDRFSRQAQDFAKELFPDIEICEGVVGAPRPINLSQPGDVLLSFLSPWIVTAEELARFSLALNFHPASTDYPGSGCYNFALYDNAVEYGATCHHMLPQVDTGRVVDERRFPVLEDDTVETLKLRTTETMLAMFKEIAMIIASRAPLPVSHTHWSREPYTRRQLEALRILTEEMSPCEIRRRTRAIVYPGFPGPELHRKDGTIVVMPVPIRPALA